MAEKAKLNTKIFLRLVAYAKVYKGIFVLAFGAGLLIAASSALRPKFIGEMLDKYVVHGQDGQMLVTWTLIIIGMLIMESVLQFAGSYFSNLLAQNIVRDLRKKLYKHVISFKMQYFDRTPIGALVTRVVSDLEAVSQVFSSGLIDIMGDIITLLFVLGIMVSVNAKLTLLALLPIPILLIATRIFARAMQKSFQLERMQPLML